MRFILSFFLLISAWTHAQVVKFDSLELIGSNVSRVLEFKEFYELDNNDSIIFKRHWTGEMLLDSVGNYSGFFNNEYSKFGIIRGDTVFIGNNPKVVLLSNGTVYWYYYGTNMAVQYDSITGNYNREFKIGFPDSVIVQNSDRVLATYKYEYTYSLTEVISKQRKVVGHWHFCHQFDNKYLPIENGDTITLKRNTDAENCSDSHHLIINSNGTVEYSGDTLNIKGLPYPNNYKDWYLNERGIFFTMKDGLPLDAWKVQFMDNETLLLIYDWEVPD